MKNKYIIITLAFLLLVSVYYVYTLPDKSALVSCLNQKQVTLYYSNWCEHCQEQKEIFGTYQDKLNTFDCGGSKDTLVVQECLDKKISRLPTWLDANGNSIIGTANLETLAQKFGCEL